MQDQSAGDLNAGSESFNEWYDASIDWTGRLGREVPVLADVFGPPGEGGIIDAGCGTGRHLCDLARRGYRVVGADYSEEMLSIAKRHVDEAGVKVELLHTPYATLFDLAGGGYDGIFCFANSLAAAGTAEAVAEALDQFAKCLRPGGRFCIEILNFTPMLNAIQDEEAKEATGEAEGEGGFTLDPSRVTVTKIKIGDGTRKEERSKDEPKPGSLYPASYQEMDEWCAAAGLTIDKRLGSFMCEPYEMDKAVDLIVIGTKN